MLKIEIVSIFHRDEGKTFYAFGILIILAMFRCGVNNTKYYEVATHSILIISNFPPRINTSFIFFVHIT